MNPSPRARMALFAAVLTVWTVALLFPEPGQVVEGTIDDAEVLFLISKMVHVGGYAFLTVLGGFATSSRVGTWAVLGLLSLHAAGTEYFQQFVGRGSALFDVGLNHLGIAVGLALSWSRRKASRRPAGGRGER